jgi:hypothetical protein
VRPLYLVRVPGEAPQEIVFYRACGDFSLWVKHEYPAAPCWEWILVQGKDPIAFGDEPTQAAAEAALREAVAEFVPEYQVRPADQQNPPGLLRRLWRQFLIP